MDYIGFYQKHVEGLRKAGSQYQGWCPFHDDQGSKMKGFSVNPNDGQWWCFSCQRGGNTLTFCKLKGLPLKQAPDYDPNFINYSYAEGAMKKKQKKGTKSFWEGTKGTLPPDPFNVAAIDHAKNQERTLWICEGEKDTLTMIENGELAIGIPSASSDKVLDGLSFVGIPEVIIAFDNDEAGRKATDRVIERFPFARYIQWPDDKKKGYDVSDMASEEPNFIETLKTWAKTLDPFPPQNRRLIKKYDRDMSRDANKLLGYDCSKFQNLASNIDGIQAGFYVVAAETNAGKTAFLCNLTLDLMDTNQGLRGLYFSLDDNWDTIINRMLSIKTGIPLNKVQKAPPTSRHEKMVMDGYNYLTDLMKDERLFIRDASDIQDVNDLEIEIRRRHNRPLFVVIDALYNLEMNLEGQDQRRENIERANRLKAIATAFDIPVIATGELRKSKERIEKNKPPTIDDIMETGKFAYNANLVLLLYPESWDAYDQEDEPILTMKYAKNKLSHIRGKEGLVFKRIVSQIEERQIL